MLVAQVQAPTLTHLAPEFFEAPQRCFDHPIEPFITTNHQRYPAPRAQLAAAGGMARTWLLLAAVAAVLASAAAAKSRFSACKWSDTYRYYRIVGRSGRGQRFVEKVKVSAQFWSMPLRAAPNVAKGSGTLWHPGSIPCTLLSYFSKACACNTV